jgi:hypothetical protein
VAFRSTHRPFVVASIILLPFTLHCGTDDRNPSASDLGGAPENPAATPPAGAGVTDPAPPGATEPGTGDPTNGSEENPMPVGLTPGETPTDGTGVETFPTTETPPVPEGPVVSTGYPENTGAECEVTAGALSRNENLPDPFAMNDGTRITTKAQWPCRRNEIKRDLEQFEIGTKPEPPSVAASISGNTLNVNVTTPAGSITLSSNVGSPGGDGPHCVAIGMNGNSSLINGCVQVPFMHDQVVTYNQNSNVNQNDPFYTVYPDRFGNISNYSAWSWGISRIIDGLEQVKDELNIDMARIGVHGCSYAGKMALFGGALDERVALTVVQESGGGGINSWRLSQDFTTRTGTNIEKIDNTNYSWFLPSMRTIDPYSLPHDHHELIAMIAPRAVVTLGNRDFEWLGDESGYKSVMAATEVFKALGVEANIGFDFTTGHGHCQAPAIQVASVNAFVDKFLKNQQDANTNIAIQPPANGFDLDHTAVIDWQTPTLQ